MTLGLLTMLHCSSEREQKVWPHSWSGPLGEKDAVALKTVIWFSEEAGRGQLALMGSSWVCAVSA